MKRLSHRVVTLPLALVLALAALLSASPSKAADGCTTGCIEWDSVNGCTNVQACCISGSAWACCDNSGCQSGSLN
jgi:hypothetical protein